VSGRGEFVREHFPWVFVPSPCYVSMPRAVCTYICFLPHGESPTHTRCSGGMEDLRRGK
jgi:hypothetical protein